MPAPDLRPLHGEPVSVHPPYDQRRPPVHDPARAHQNRLTALLAPLAGIELGGYDHRILDWLAGWDTPTVGAVASLLHRARAAGPLDTRGGAR